MIQDFDLVDKRQIMRNTINWNNHFLVTFRKKPTYLCLNIEKLGQLDDTQKAVLFSELISYLYD